MKLAVLISYLLIAASVFEPLATLFTSLGLKGKWSATVVLAGLPILLLWLFKGKGTEQVFRLESGKRWVLIVPAGGLFYFVSTHVASASSQSVAFVPAGSVSLAALGLPVAIFTGAYFLRKPVAKARRVFSRGAKLISPEEAATLAKERTEGEIKHPVVWGGVELPEEAAPLHFLVIGSTGSGKTLTLRLLMQSFISRIGTGNDSRALIYDAKGDLFSILSGMGVAVPIQTLNPFDRRCVAWDMAKDITSPASALQLASVIIPKNAKASQPFFDNAARDLFRSVLVSFIKTSPGAWDFRDVILALTNRNRLMDVIGRTEETSDSLSYFETENSSRDIMSTLKSLMGPFEIIAACWSKAANKVSLAEWVKGEGILVLGNDESLTEAMQALNGMVFKCLSERLLAQGDSETRRSYIVLDEVREAGKLEGLGRVLTNGRSKGVCIALGFQDIEGMREVWGPRIANEMAGQCNHKAILRLRSPETAKWAAELIGNQEALEERTSRGESHHGLRFSSSSSKSLTLQKIDAVMASQLLTIPPTNRKNGLKGFYQSPYTDTFKKTLSPKWLSANLRKPNDYVQDVIPRMKEDQYIQPWDQNDAKRLNLIQSAASSGVLADSQRMLIDNLSL